MSIKLTVRKVVVRGEQKMILKNVEGMLSWKELPSVYTEDGTSEDGTYYCYYENNHGIYFRGIKYISINSYIKQEHIDYIKKAGERLKQINKELKEKNKDWHGEVVFVI